MVEEGAYGRPNGPDSSGFVSPEVIREELNRVLLGHSFRSSKRSQDFLRYIVEITLSGHSAVLKERTIGIEVFGRSTDYDPSDDATVRVKAGEVRRRLGQHYAGKGAQHLVRIELPSGTYIPEFHPVTAADGGTGAETPPEAPPPDHQVRSGRWSVQALSGRALRIGAGAAVLCLAAAALLWLRTRPARTALDEFWTPVLDGTPPVLLCAAFVPVYGSDRDSAVPPEQLARGELSLMTDQFVGGGDLMAASRLSSMLTRMNRDYRLKIGNDVSFHDLRTGPAILIGYSYTRWREISSQMRYFIDGTRRPVGILDNGVPTKWALPSLPRNRRTNEDYAIVSRVFHPDTRAMLVEIAGITQYGTDAASDLVTNGDLLAETLKGAPAGWQKKNLQIVVYVKVISGVPSSPRVVGTHVW